MRYAVPLAFIAGPAFAHHEVVVVSVVPGLSVWLASVAALCLIFWKRRGKR